jgi:hypothetical protein
MVKFISALGFLATITQLLAVFHARRVAAMWPVSGVRLTVELDVLPYLRIAVPLGLLGFVIGLSGITNNRNHWGTKRAIGLATALCFVGMIPLGLLKCTWIGVWEERVMEHQASRR